ncbi:MAG: ribosome recycling factor [Waddliaceae bacterium]
MGIVNETVKKMKAAIEHLKDELKKIRTGQANPAMVENVPVEVYGAQMRLREVASITSPEQRQLLITPYDVNNAGVIAKAIEKANLGFMPVVDSNSIRITIPQMDESIRKDMVKLCHKRKEESKVTIRNIRRYSNEVVKAQKADGEIGEDIMKKLEKEIQELTDRYCNEADDLTMKKESEVATI